MKLKGGYRYSAKLSYDEACILKNALELLLEQYEDDPYQDSEYHKGLQSEQSVKKILDEFNEHVH